MKGEYILFMMLFFFSLLACNDENDAESFGVEDSVYGIVGQWYVEKTGNSELEMFAEYTFTLDGAVYFDEYRRRNGYRRDEGRGSYHIEENRFISNIESNTGMPIQIGTKLLNLKSLAFTSESKDYGEMLFLRIVRIVSSQVGDTIRLDIKPIIEEYASQEVEIIAYAMKDKAIASIDDNGVLTAKLIGQTYLKIETSIGPAVVKIIVSDTDHLWNDFSQVLGKDFDEVEHLLGKYYAFRSDSIRYFYDNRYIESIDIYKHKGIADSVVVSFHKDVPKELIIDYMKNKLVPVDTLKDWYTNNKNYLLATYSAKYNQANNKLVYTGFDPEWDDRIDDYGLSFEELKEKYGDYSSKTNNMVIYENKIKNDFVAEIAYWGREKVKEYHITVNDNIPIEMLEEYLKTKFIYTYRYGQWQYLRNVQKEGREMFIHVSIGDKGHHSLYYYFEENN